MYKLCVVVLALLAAVSAKPTFVASPVAYTAGVPLAYSAPLVTATSSQYIARNYNGVVAAPYVSAPLAYPYGAAYSYAATYPYAAATYPYASAALVV